MRTPTFYPLWRTPLDRDVLKLYPPRKDNVICPAVLYVMQQRKKNNEDQTDKETLERLKREYNESIGRGTQKV